MHEIGGATGPSRRALRGLAAVGILALAAWMGAAAAHADRPVVAAAMSLASLGLLSLLPRAPVLALAGSLTAPVVVSLAAGGSGSDDPFLVLAIASSYAIGRYAPFHHQPYAAAGVLALTSMNVLAPGPFAVPQQLVFPVLVVAAPWLSGLVVRRAAERAEHAVASMEQLTDAHRHEVEQQIAQERVRLARELHDISAHTMSVVALQAQLMRRRIEHDQPIALDDARDLELSARAALVELREAVALLRPAAPGLEPLVHRGIDDLRSLVDDCTRAGQPVSLQITGCAPPLRPSISHTIYRIVQESLSNARRHGATPRAAVTIDYDDERARIVVRNPTMRTSQTDDRSPGLGLIGMRERVSLHRGHLETGPSSPGTWTVDATIPFA